MIVTGDGPQKDVLANQLLNIEGSYSETVGHIPNWLPVPLTSTVHTILFYTHFRHEITMLHSMT